MSDSVGSVSVDVVPDARGWSEKLRAQIRDVTATVNADADTGEAEAKLDEVARTRTAKIKTDTSTLSKGNQLLGDFTSKLGLLPALAIAGGAALVPLAGALGGVVAALVAPLAIAGGGATLFAVLAGFAVKDTEKQLKSIDSLQTKLDGLTKGTKEYADAQRELQAAQKALSPSQTAFSNAQGALGGAFQDFIGGKAGAALLGPLTQGMKLLADILPSLTPVLVAAGGAFSTLLGDIDRAASGPGFDKFIGLVSGQVGHDLVGFGRVAGNIAKGLGSLFVVLDKKAGTSLVDQLVRLSGAFADWASSDSARKGIRSFFGYVHDVGPQVASTIGSLARALGKVVEALAPLGPPVLKGIETAANALSSIPTPVLTGLAAATAGLVAFGKVGGFKVTGGILGKLTSGSSLGGGILGSAKPVPVFVTNPGFGGKPGVGGTGAPGGGALNKFGTVAAGATAVGAINAGLDPLFKKEFGTNVGDAIVRGIRGAFALPDPKLASAGPRLFNSIVNGPGHSPGQLPTDSAPSGFLAAQSRAATDRARAAAFSGLGTGPLQAVEKHLSLVASALDATRSHAATASRGLDLIGPHGVQAAGVASHAIDALQHHLDSLHDKRFQVIAETGSAIASLERLQAIRIQDKSFTVYQRNQVIERAVGPGGGRGVSNPSGSGGGASGGGSGRTPVHIHLDDNGKRVLTGTMDDRYRQNADADRAYDAARAGR